MPETPKPPIIQQHDKLLKEVIKLRDMLILSVQSVTPEQVFNGAKGEFHDDIQNLIISCESELQKLKSKF